MDNYIVYVLTETDGRIKAINSSTFLPDVTGWVQIDRGVSEKFGHAQNNYLTKPLIDEQGRYRYKLVDGVAVERTPDELAADTLPEPQPTEAERLDALESAMLEMIMG